MNRPSNRASSLLALGRSHRESANHSKAIDAIIEL